MTGLARGFCTTFFFCFCFFFAGPVAPDDPAVARFRGGPRNGADIRNRHVVLVIRVLCVGDEKIRAPLGGWILAILGLLPSKPLRDKQKSQVNVGGKYGTPT